jgi:multicomponent Na+:H+ antiporter subunit D
VAHAFCHILYKGLLFMSTGSVLYMTGKIRATDLGGLYKTMPITAIFCMIGAASISAFPLFSGFISKSMIISAAGHDKLVVAWLILQFASAGVFHHAGIKVPFFTFFGHDSGIRTKEPPLNMMIAMGIAAFLCIFLGVFPRPLYSILPFPVHYVPYTGAHVVGQLQLLMFGALAFCLLILSGYYPAEIRAINLDTDWFYRKGGRLFYGFADKVLNSINAASGRFLVRDLSAGLGRWSRVPVSSLVALYEKAAGRDTQETVPSKEAPKPETENLIPLGVPVFLSVIGLFFVFILFIALG